MIISIIYEKTEALQGQMIYPRSPLIFVGRGKMLREWDNQHCALPDVAECVAHGTTSEACLPENIEHKSN